MAQLKRFTLQWHITENCNWKCRHCYQEKTYCKDELSLPKLKQTLTQYISFLQKHNIPQKKARLNITGGEPLLRKDFFEFAEEISRHANCYAWGLLSNGSLLTKSIVKRLKKLGINHYQVSIEGGEELNDKIRGSGAFRKTISAIEFLRKENIKTAVSLTLTKENVSQAGLLAKTLSKLGVYQFGTRRLIPHGIGAELMHSMLKPMELNDYYHLMTKLNKKLRSRDFNIVFGCESGIFNQEESGKLGASYCAVKKGMLLTIMPNGDVYPCRRLPIKVGNVSNNSLIDIYESEKVMDIRNIINTDDFCKTCRNFKNCYGGALCVNYTYTGKLFIPDVQCWEAYGNLEPPEYFKKHVDLVHDKIELVN